MPFPAPLTFRKRLRYASAFGLAAAFALGGAFACSDKLSEPSSEVMIALQSDMSLPKDVSSVRIQVLENGAFKFDHSYPVGGPTDAKIPATLAVAGDPGMSIEVRVIGFRGSEARTLTKAITTIPDGRIALLRMPIQWLCEGNVLEVGADTFQSTCQSSGGLETSCLGGTCKAVTQPSAQLPDFSPQAVFGGGDGKGNGSCFPTETCMDSGFDIQPNMGDCSVDVRGTDSTALNFAVRTAMGGDGICSSANCSVPLDKHDEFGWREDTTGSGDGSGADAGTREDASIQPIDDGGSEVLDSGKVDSGTADASSGFDSGADSGPAPAPSGGGGSAGLPPLPSDLQPQQAGQQGMRHVKLPQGVCDRIQDGRALGLRATTSCTTKTADIPACGPWSSVGAQGNVNPGTDGGTSSDCPQFVPGQQLPPGVTGDTTIDSYLQAVSDLYWNAEDQKNRAATACVNALKPFGVAPTLSNPPTDEEVTQTCAQARSFLESSGVGGIAVGVQPGLCSADIMAQQACETGCMATGCNSVPADARCEKTTGPCLGNCYGDCYPQQQGGNVQCQQGECSGQCSGTCSGACSQTGPLGECNGLCDGACSGTCQGVCKMAGAQCSGICVADPDSGFLGCDVVPQPLSCAVPLQPGGCGDLTCAYGCAAQAANDQNCTQTIATVFDPDAPPLVVEAINQNVGPVTDVAIQSEGLMRAASYLQFARESLSTKTDLTAQQASCMNVASITASNAAYTINNNAMAAIDLLGVGGSGGSVGTGGVGTGGGSGLDGGSKCMGGGEIPLIDDFEDADYNVSPYDGRVGNWTTFTDDYGYITVSGPDLLPAARGASTWGLHVTATECLQWGAEWLVEINGGNCYDASLWGGISLWVMSDATVSSLQVRVVTTDTITGCVAATGHTCAFYATVGVTAAWSNPVLSWTAFSNFDGSIAMPAFDPAQIIAIEIAEQSASPSFWVDDVSFF